MSKELQELEAAIEGGLESMGRPRRLFVAERDRSVLIVVDMQNAFCSPSGALENPAARDVVGNINRLVRVCRECEIPVVWLKQEFRADGTDMGLLPRFHVASPHGYSRGKPLEELAEGSHGAELWPELDVDEERDWIVPKCRYSPFTPGSSKLDGLLRTLGRRNLMIAGTATNVCCEVTARDAMMYDYEVICIGDAMATTSNLLHRVALLNLRVFYADVATTAEVLEELSS